MCLELEFVHSFDKRRPWWIFWFTMKWRAKEVTSFLIQTSYPLWQRDYALVIPNAERSTPGWGSVMIKGGEIENKV